MNKKKEMPFWDHVYEIRNRLLFVIISILVLSIGSYFLYPYIFEYIYDVIGEQLYATGIAEGFLTRLEISILFGLFFSLPVFLIQIILFLFPGFKRKEKVYMIILLLSSYILFIFGIAFAFHSVLPISVSFLKSRDFFPENLGRLISYNQFISFFSQFLIGFGICFQFPIILIFLLKTGAVQLNSLIKNFKYVIAVIFIVAAIITPPDVVSQILLALPMIVLYVLCILIGKVMKLGGKKEEK